MACGRRGHAWGLCALAFLLGCWVAHAAPRVGLYMKESTDVVSLTWDTAPANLHTQLTQLGFDVVPDTVGRPSGDAYIIPVQNDAAFFSSVEDMGAAGPCVPRTPPHTPTTPTRTHTLHPGTGCPAVSSSNAKFDFGRT